MARTSSRRRRISAAFAAVFALVGGALVGCSAAAAPSAPGGSGSSGAGKPGPQTELDAELRDAAWANDVSAARRLVAVGADVNAKDETRQSAYLVATSEGYLELLRLTLENGAKIDDLDSWDGTGLIRSAERGHGDVVGALLLAGIDRDHVNRIGYQAIHEAVWFGEDTPEYATTVRALIAGGVELARPSENERLTPLQMAQERRFAGLERTLRAGEAAEAVEVADADARLIAAVRAGDADAAAVALRAGAAADAKDPGGGRTAREIAETSGYADVLSLLVALGAAAS